MAPSAHSALARAPAGGTTHSTPPLTLEEIERKRRERGHAYACVSAREAGPVLRVVPADPTGWANPCHWYRDHQSKHRQTPSGWTCDACYPEEGPIA